ncbi:hypothetical protein [Ornithobacterium rhinotracheale]|uniref:hypothetical protein n=1 Tax=Ornithobacterium rhinotracheale TaxID=28251 RepID=UPI00403551EF
MKKTLLLIILLFTSACAKTAKNKGKSLRSISIVENEPKCSVECGVTFNIDGVVVKVSTEGGWLLSGCERASRKCLEKLGKIIKIEKEEEIDSGIKFT